MFLKKLSLASVACLLVTSACVVNDADDDGSTGTSGTPSTTASTTASTTTTTSTSTTDDPSTTTDGTTTDAPTTGGETDPTTGGLTTTDTDTDSGTDSATGDTDTDTDGVVPTCGWGPLRGADVDNGYQCYLEGEDPRGTFPLACPKGADLTLGADCTAAMVRAEGCCDENANVWYCFDPDGDGPQETEVGMDDCSIPE